MNELGERIIFKSGTVGSQSTLFTFFLWDSVFQISVIQAP